MFALVKQSGERWRAEARGSCHSVAEFPQYDASKLGLDTNTIILHIAK